MNYSAFVEHIAELMRERLPENWEETKVSIVTVDKINHSRTGLSFDRKDTKCSPTIYLEELYGHYNQGMSLEEVLEEICSILREMDVAEKIDISRTSMEKRNDLIIFQLIHTESNQSLLARMPHRTFEDLSVVYMWLMKCDGEGVATIPVENQTADLFGLTEEQLYELAYENTKRLLPFKTKTMEEVIRQLAGKLELEVESEVLQDKSEGFYVISNQARTFGAIAMLYPEIFDEIADIQGDDLYVIPSSRHEVVTLPKKELALEEVVEMVEKTNEQDREIEDILSNQIYQYDRGARVITKATDLPFRPFRQNMEEEIKEEGIEKSTGR